MNELINNPAAFAVEYLTNRNNELSQSQVALFFASFPLTMLAAVLMAYSISTKDAKIVATCALSITICASVFLQKRSNEVKENKTLIDILKSLQEFKNYTKSSDPFVTYNAIQAFQKAVNISYANYSPTIMHILSAIKIAHGLIIEPRETEPRENNMGYNFFVPGTQEEPYVYAEANEVRIS